MGDPSRVGESPWEHLTGQVALGGTEFVRRLRPRVQGNRREQPGLRQLTARPSLDQVIAVVEQIKGERWSAFRDRYGDWGRDLVL
jgi:hypothetical protein